MFVGHSGVLVLGLPIALLIGVMSGDWTWLLAWGLFAVVPGSLKTEVGEADQRLSMNFGSGCANRFETLLAVDRARPVASVM